MNGDGKKQVESHQRGFDNLALALASFVCIALMFVFWRYTRTELAGQILILVDGVVGGSLLLKLYLRLVKTPRRISVTNDYLFVEMYFGSTYVIRLGDLVRLEFSPSLSAVLAPVGWLVCSKPKIKFALSRPFMENLPEVLAAIRAYNPSFPLDERIMSWEGPRHII